LTKQCEKDRFEIRNYRSQHASNQEEGMRVRANMGLEEWNNLKVGDTIEDNIRNTWEVIKESEKSLGQSKVFTFKTSEGDMQDLVMARGIIIAFESIDAFLDLNTLQ
jgi:hypothetical protein